MRRWLPLGLILLALACGDDGPVRPTHPPTILGLSLAPDSVLSATVAITVEVDRADSVALWIDGGRADAVTRAPFVFAWDSFSVTDGSHLFALRATNSAGFSDSVFTRPVNNYGEMVLAIGAAPQVVRIGRTYPLTAEFLSGEPRTPVTWSVTGGPEYGTIDAATGLYTAPASVPNPAVVTFRVVTQSSPPVLAEAVATISEPVAVEVNGYPREIYLTQTYQLGARVEHAEDTRVRWSMDEDAEHGTVDENGIYTAPSALPTTSAVTFRAVSLEDTTAWGTATGYIIGNIRLSVSPDSTWLHPGGSFQFTADVEGAPPESVQWWVVGGSENGTIDASGTYTAPPRFDLSRWVQVVARCTLEPDVRDTVRVELRPFPPDSELLRAMYQVVFNAATISERATGIGATALCLEQSPSGNNAASPGTTFLDFDRTTGSLDYCGSSSRQYRGIEYKGDLDFSMHYGPNKSPAAVSVTNSSAPRFSSAKPNSWGAGAAFDRTLDGTMLAEDEGIWSLDCSVSGEMWTGYDAQYSYYGFDLTVSGGITTPAGMRVTADAEVANQTRYVTVGVPAKLDWFLESFEGGFTARVGEDVYEWKDVSFYRTGERTTPEDLDRWHASGTILKNGLVYGEVRFDRPVTGTMTEFPVPVAVFPGEVTVPLNEMPVSIDGPGGLVYSPYGELGWY